MEERDFFDEQAEQKVHMMTCPHCGQSNEYSLSWLIRRKRPQLPRGADDQDRMRFAKAKSYMVRREDMVGCKNVRCRKRFDVVGIQSVAYMQEATAGTGADSNSEDREARLRAAFGRKNLG